MSHHATDALTRALAQADPEGLIAAGAPADEYLPEAEALLAHEYIDADAVREVFRTMFDETSVSAHSEQFWELLAQRCREALRS